MQRGEESNSTGVLSRLDGSGEMFLFLHDSAEVQYRSASNGEPRERKNYTLKILSLRAKIPFPTWIIVIMMNLMLCSIEKV